jgi:hypothetical protein
MDDLHTAIRDLIRHAREHHPDWDEWTLLMRPETYALLSNDLDAGLLWHPDPAYAPLEVEKFEECEVVHADLVRDIVLVTPGAGHGPAPSPYWLDLASGHINKWTGDEPEQWQQHSDR